MTNAKNHLVQRGKWKTKVWCWVSQILRWHPVVIRWNRLDLGPDEPAFQAFKTSGSRGHDFPPTPPRNHIPRKESRSSPVSVIEMQPQRTSDRRGSVGQRRRSNSVFAKGLVQPALVLLRVRRRSRALSSREIKLLRVSYNRLSRFVKRQDFLKRYLNLSGYQ